MWIRLHLFFLLFLLAFVIFPTNAQCPYGKRKPRDSFANVAADSEVQDRESYAVNNILSGGLVRSNFLYNNIDHGSRKSQRLQCAVPLLNCSSDPTNYYYRSHNGECNNLQYPGYGISNSRYTRLLHPRYSDGIYSATVSVTGAPLPNPRLISLSMYGERTLPDDFRTLASLHWGQLVAHDISAFSKNGAPSDCCAANNANNHRCYPISLISSGPISAASGKTCWNFVRGASDTDAICPGSGLSYAEKITTTTAFLDLSFLYGSSQEANNRVRLFRGGLLRTQNTNHRQYPPLSANENGDCGVDNYQCFDIPDVRNQIVPTTAALHIIFLREHNRIASALAALNPQYSDERLYQEARKINIAQYQKITYYNWLPLSLGESFALSNGLIYQTNDYVNDYNPAVSPAPYAEFSAAAFRYGHNQIPGWFSLYNPGRDYNESLRLSDHIERPENVNLLSNENHFDSLLRGLITQHQKRADSNIDSELKHHFERKAFEAFGTDLKAIDIQRGRDYGLGSYNDLRELCGLPRAQDWLEFANELSPQSIDLLKRVYASPEDVDLSVGGSLEIHVPESNFGPTFQCIVARQFANSRISDRFFFEREDPYSGFSRAQLAEIRKASVSALLCNNADYLQLIQPNAFIVPGIRNELVSCSAIPRIDLSHWRSSY